MSRTKMVTVLAAMALTFAILPTFGASAAPLDGEFTVSIPDGPTYDITVDEGQPALPDGVGFYSDNGAINDGEQFLLTVAGAQYKVTITLGDTGTYDVSVIASETGEEQTGEEQTGEEQTGEEQTGEEQTGEEQAEKQTHGDIVSAVAACAPRGPQVKDLELPTHGKFVSAAAKGGSHTFTVATGQWTVDFGAEDFNVTDFCEVTLPEMIAAAEAAPSTEQPTDGGQSTDGETTEATGDETRGNGNGNGQARQAEKDNGRPDNAGPKNKD